MISFPVDKRVCKISGFSAGFIRDRELVCLKLHWTLSGLGTSEWRSVYSFTELTGTGLYVGKIWGFLHSVN